MTPDIEHYIRCSVTVGKWTVEPGIEYRDGDDESELASGIESMASAICGAMHEPHAPGPMAVSRSFEWSFRSRWPGRAFFIEIHSTDHRWTQTFQPYGVPRRHADEPDLLLLSQAISKIHTTLGGKPEEIAGDAARRVVSERDFYSRKVYDAVDSARRAKDELDACREELRVATADRDRHAANEDHLLDLNTQLAVVRDRHAAIAHRLLDLQDEAIEAFGMPGVGLAEAARQARRAVDRIAMVDGAYKNAVIDRDSFREKLHEETVGRRAAIASLDSWRTQAQVLANQVLAARDAIDGRNADTLTEAIQALRSELGASDGETVRQAVLRVLAERDDAVSRLEGV